MKRDPANPAPIIGQRRFTDGSQRAVYADEDDRQFVMDDAGRRVYGFWLIPSDETEQPVIVDHAERPN